LNKFKIFKKRKKYSTNKKFFTHILFFVNHIEKVFNLRIPQFPQELLLLKFFIFLFIFILEKE